MRLPYLDLADAPVGQTVESDYHIVHRKRDGTMVVPRAAEDGARLLYIEDVAFELLTTICGGSLERMTVLDVACHAGHFSLAARRRGAQNVLGTDARIEGLEFARSLAADQQLSGIDFKQMDVFDISPASVGEFDITLCLGLIYHLDNPVGALRNIRSVTRKVCVIETQAFDGGVATVEKSFGYAPLAAKQLAPMMVRYEPDTHSRLTHVAGVTIVPSREAVAMMAYAAGFSVVLEVHPRADHFYETARPHRALFVAFPGEHASGAFRDRLDSAMHLASVISSRQKLPEDWTPIYKIASYWEQLGRLQESEELFRAIVAAAPLRQLVSGAWYHMGCIRLSQSDPEGAREFFEHCLKVEPNHKKASEGFGRLSAKHR
ncbi:MAG: methyltransferase domain-containing protein [Nitrospirae bacterium]|nr:methyltransferase domain-containing protein [Nitrospirota bacterium]